MEEIKLDLKDKKILFELEMNARIPYSLLARKAGLSKQVVKYRVEKLESSGIVQGYNALIDLNRLGRTIYIVYLKLIGMSSSKEKAWIKELGEDNDVLTVGRNAGQWDLTIVIACRNNQEFDGVFKRITSGKSDKIKDRLITSEIESTYFKLQLVLKSSKTGFSTSNSQSAAKLDDKDLKLLRALADNCRLSLIELSDKLDFSPNGIKDRIKRLEERKVIFGYKTKIDYEKLGYLHFRVFLRLANFTEGIYSRISAFLGNRGNVESVSRYMGYADVDFRCYCKNLSELYGMISEIKDNFLGEIIEVSSIPIFGWEKMNYYPRQ